MFEIYTENQEEKGRGSAIIFLPDVFGTTQPLANMYRNQALAGQNIYQCFTQSAARYFFNGVFQYFDSEESNTSEESDDSDGNSGNNLRSNQQVSIEQYAKSLAEKIHVEVEEKEIILIAYSWSGFLLRDLIPGLQCTQEVWREVDGEYEQVHSEAKRIRQLIILDTDLNLSPLSKDFVGITYFSQLLQQVLQFNSEKILQNILRQYSLDTLPKYPNLEDIAASLSAGQTNIAEQCFKFLQQTLIELKNSYAEVISNSDDENFIEELNKNLAYLEGTVFTHLEMLCYFDINKSEQYKDINCSVVYPGNNTYTKEHIEDGLGMTALFPDLEVVEIMDTEHLSLPKNAVTIDILVGSILETIRHMNTVKSATSELETQLMKAFYFGRLKQGQQEKMAAFLGQVIQNPSILDTFTLTLPHQEAPTFDETTSTSWPPPGVKSKYMPTFFSNEDEGLGLRRISSFPAEKTSSSDVSRPLTHP